MNRTRFLSFLLTVAVLKAEIIPKTSWAQRKGTYKLANNVATRIEQDAASFVRSTDLPDPDMENPITPSSMPLNVNPIPSENVNPGTSSNASTTVTPTPSFPETAGITPSQTVQSGEGQNSAPTNTPRAVFVSASPTPTPKKLVQGIPEGQQNAGVSISTPSVTPTPWLSEEIKGAITGSVIGGIFAIAATAIGVWRCRIVRRVRTPLDGEMDTFY